MTDEMEEFETLLKTDVPAPNADAKKTALLGGLEAFDKEFANKRQGTRSEGRLMDAVRTFHNTLFGGQSMKPRHIISGAAVLVIGIALLNTSSLVPLVPVLGGSVENKVKQRPERVAPAQQLKSNSITPGELPTPPSADADTGSYSSKTSSSYSSNGAEGGAVPDLSKLQSPPAPPMPTGRATANASDIDTGLLFSLRSSAIPAPKPMEKPLAARREARKSLSTADSIALDSVMGKVQSMAKNEELSKDKEAFAAEKKAVAPALAASPMPNYSAPGMIAPPAPPPVVIEPQPSVEEVKVNPTKITREEPVSTFSIDVDTSSYSLVRAQLNGNVLPAKDTVRIEELVNYFPYNYEGPESKETPFKSNVSVMPTPWNTNTKLIHIGIKGYDIAQKEKPHANLVFLIDTSGSMNEPNKLPLVISSLKMLLDTLNPNDTVGIVTYAGWAGVALEPTAASDKARIIQVLDSLGAGGSTAGSEGIRTAYQLAAKHLNKEGVNRVILATDGDFNVGISDQASLKQFIEHERDGGIFLSVLGFGTGNYNDATMQTLAQNGNGNAAYIDNLNEARKELVQEAGSTLFTIAKDVKIQVEFNPAKVAEYRLIGYETRLLKREDFNNDKIDAGDIGAGHTVTALYEITPVGSEARTVDDLRYGSKDSDKKEVDKAPAGDEYAFVKIRYKLPDSDTSKLITTPVDDKVEFKDIASVPQEARFAVAVAGYGQLLRGDSTIKSFTYDDVAKLAQGAKGEDSFGYRTEFINLVRQAEHAVRTPAQPYNGYYQPPYGGVVPMQNR